MLKVTVKGKMVIWTISFWYPPNFSGRGIQAHREHSEFVKHGLTINVLTAGINAAGFERDKTVIMDGVSVRYLPVIPIPSWSSISKYKGLYKILFSISTNLSAFSFAVGCAWVILFHGHRNDVIRIEGYNRYAVIPLAVIRCKGLHSILRMSLLGSDDPYSVLTRAKHGQVLEYITLASFKSAEKIVSICSAMIETCRKAEISEEKVIYIPHGVDTDHFQPVDETDRVRKRQSLGLDPAKRYILFVGSAIKRKGIDVLIDSFIQIRREMNDVDLLIIGPDRFDERTYENANGLQDMVDTCKDKLSEAGFNDSVHWIGEVPDVREYMDVADVFCLPTRQEGFGIVIIEAMASGLPVVISQLEGVTTDIIASAQEGLLIEGFQFQDYAEALMKLLNNPQEATQMGSAARSRAVSVFSLERARQRWIELFNELTQG